MGVKVRERPAGSNCWWVFINHKGMRKAKKCGPEKLANKVAEIIEANLKLGRPMMGEEEKPPLPTLAQYYERFKERLFGVNYFFPSTTIIFPGCFPVLSRFVLDGTQ